jgi:hypothetical protein
MSNTKNSQVVSANGGRRVDLVVSEQFSIRDPPGGTFCLVRSNTERLPASASKKDN